MRPFTTTLALLACIASQYLPVTNASPAVSCAHNTPSSSSATTTPASFVQTPSRSLQVLSTSASTSTSQQFVAPPVAAGIVVSAGHVVGGEQPSAAAASITQAPATGAGSTAKRPGAKFIQTTYYSCVTMGTYTHCGWHEPILDASTSDASLGLTRSSWLAMSVVAVAVGLVVL